MLCYRAVRAACHHSLLQQEPTSRLIPRDRHHCCRSQYSPEKSGTPTFQPAPPPPPPSPATLPSAPW
ncbi:hypothetical protein ABBQ32_013193 [Trebouxia sp. C0010 RCD-2024]